LVSSNSSCKFSRKDHLISKYFLYLRF
jgi:hypothetical protein